MKHKKNRKNHYSSQDSHSATSLHHHSHLKKRLGQHLLVDRRVLAREVSYADVEEKSVLEIGAGTGNLTELLVQKAKHVIAVEKDREMIPILLERLSKFENLDIINTDFLQMPLPHVDRVVSNVPYNISSPLLFRLLEMNSLRSEISREGSSLHLRSMKFEKALLCFQKEFAERLVAKQGTRNYSRLSVMAQLQFDIELLEYVPRGSFRPAPKVDSAVVRLVPTGFVLTEKQARVITALFIHRKKTVRNALRDSFHMLSVKKEEIKIQDERRVFMLGKEEILKICEKL